MKMTPQDIIDKEFRVKFRGFDMAEVDTFLEEAAENLLKLTEENTQLHERIAALQQELESAGSMTRRGQAELPAELENILEDLKQDTASIGAELVALKQDRLSFTALEKNLKAAVAAIRESAASAAPQKQPDIPGGLDKTLEEFKQGTDSMGAELAALKNEVAGIANIRQELKQELQGLFATHFAAMEARQPTAAGVAAEPAPRKPEAAPEPQKTKKKLPAARIEEEPEKPEEEASLPDYSQDDADSDDGDLEFLSEDDIMDVDRLRGIFQSVLDEGISDGHENRDGDEATADLLFLDDDFMEDEHEPEVTFSLDEKSAGGKDN